MPLDSDYSYDIATLVGQTRLHAADTDIALDEQGPHASFADAEINYFLSISGSDPILAAAMALDALAADRSKLTIRVKTLATDTDLTKLAQDLRDMAMRLREVADVAPAVDSPDQIFSTDNSADGVIGTMDCW